MLLKLERCLDALRHVGHAAAGSTRAGPPPHAVRLAAAILQPVVPGAEPPPCPDGTARLMEMIGNWCDAVLDLGKFAPARPVLRVIPGSRES